MEIAGGDQPLFKDFFSANSALYREWRPSYPRALFEYLASLLPPTRRQLALDVATGNGQAASQLADFFDVVLACDASANQIANAIAKPNIHYQVLTAEILADFAKLPNKPAGWCLLAESSCDLLTVATGVHWISDIAAFNRTAAFLLKPDGIFAIWAYNGRPRFADNAELNELLRAYYAAVTEYASTELYHVDNRYEGIPFAFEELFIDDVRRERPSFDIELHWTIDNLIGRLQTASRLQSYVKATGKDLLADEFKAKFQTAWKQEQERVVVNVFMRVGRNKKS